MTEWYVQNRGDWPIDTIGGPAWCVNAVGNFGAVFSVIALPSTSRSCCFAGGLSNQAVVVQVSLLRETEVICETRVYLLQGKEQEVESERLKFSQGNRNQEGRNNWAG